MTSEYINKLETVSKERRAFEANVRKHKLAQLGLMENVGLYTQPILTEQERAHKAIESLQDHVEETTPKKQIEFQDTFQIDFRNIDQDLPKSIRPIFSQDRFKIGKAYIEVDKGRCLMRVCGKHNAYETTEELVDLIKGKPLHDYSRELLDDYKNLLNNVGASTRSKRYRHLSGTPVGEEFSFLPDNVQELQARLEKLIVAAKEGHTNVFNEGMVILKRLLEMKAITLTDISLTKNFYWLLKKWQMKQLLVLSRSSRAA